jgi:mono/diheme cytochrome c family protein
MGVTRNIRRAARPWLLAAVIGVLAVPAAWGDEGGRDAGEAILKARCAGCHNLQGPAPASLEALRDRKGPDLSFAGDKYRPEWVAAWLQAPKRIRPAGMFYGRHIKPGAQWDQVDTTTLKPHVKLSTDDAEAVAAALATRTPNRERLAKVTVAPASISIMMGDLMFEKFKGCIACHQSGPDYGGFSGPELYTAARRLTPAYLYSYMQNPQAWDPKIWMPNMHLSETDLNKLVRYLELVAREVEKPDEEGDE